jgi:DUF1680 family protein
LRIANVRSRHFKREDNKSAEFSLFRRLPRWLANQSAMIQINGENFIHNGVSGSHLEIHRRWQLSDIMSIDLPMDVRYLVSHPSVEESFGRTTITRGPLVYCLEQVDNPDVKLSEIVINPAHKPKGEYKLSLLGEIVQLYLAAEKRKINPNWKVGLYQPIRSIEHISNSNKIEVVSIPYYVWENRTPGAMKIWNLYP